MAEVQRNGKGNYVLTCEGVQGSVTVTLEMIAELKGWDDTELANNAASAFYEAIKDAVPDGLTQESAIEMIKHLHFALQEDGWVKGDGDVPQKKDTTKEEKTYTVSGLDDDYLNVNWGTRGFRQTRATVVIAQAEALDADAVKFEGDQEKGPLTIRLVVDGVTLEITASPSDERPGLRDKDIPRILDDALHHADKGTQLIKVLKGDAGNITPDHWRAALLKAQLMLSQPEAGKKLGVASTLLSKGLYLGEVAQLKVAKANVQISDPIIEEDGSISFTVIAGDEATNVVYPQNILDQDKATERLAALKTALGLGEEDEEYKEKKLSFLHMQIETNLRNATKRGEERASSKPQLRKSAPTVTGKKQGNSYEYTVQVKSEGLGASKSDDEKKISVTLKGTPLDAYQIKQAVEQAYDAAESKGQHGDFKKKLGNDITTKEQAVLRASLLIWLATEKGAKHLDGLVDYGNKEKKDAALAADLEAENKREFEAAVKEGEIAAKAAAKAHKKLEQEDPKAWVVRKSHLSSGKGFMITVQQHGVSSNTVTLMYVKGGEVTEDSVTEKSKGQSLKNTTTDTTLWKLIKAAEGADSGKGEYEVFFDKDGKILESGVAAKAPALEPVVQKEEAPITVTKSSSTKVLVLPQDHYNISNVPLEGVKDATVTLKTSFGKDWELTTKLTFKQAHDELAKHNADTWPNISPENKAKAIAALMVAWEGYQPHNVQKIAKDGDVIAFNAGSDEEKALDEMLGQLKAQEAFRLLVGLEGQVEPTKAPAPKPETEYTVTKNANAYKILIDGKDNTRAFLINLQKMNDEGIPAAIAALKDNNGHDTTEQEKALVFGALLKIEGDKGSRVYKESEIADLIKDWQKAHADFLLEAKEEIDLDGSSSVVDDEEELEHQEVAANALEGYQIKRTDTGVNARYLGANASSSCTYTITIPLGEDESVELEVSYGSRGDVLSKKSKDDFKSALKAIESALAKRSSAEEGDELLLTAEQKALAAAMLEEAYYGLGTKRGWSFGQDAAESLDDDGIAVDTLADKHPTTQKVKNKAQLKLNDGDVIIVDDQKASQDMQAMVEGVRALDVHYLDPEIAYYGVTNRDDVNFVTHACIAKKSYFDSRKNMSVAEIYKNLCSSDDFMSQPYEKRVQIVAAVACAIKGEKRLRSQLSKLELSKVPDEEIQQYLKEAYRVVPKRQVSRAPNSKHFVLAGKAIVEDGQLSRIEITTRNQTFVYEAETGLTSVWQMAADGWEEIKDAEVPSEVADAIQVSIAQIDTKDLERERGSYSIKFLVGVQENGGLKILESDRNWTKDEEREELNEEECYVQKTGNKIFVTLEGVKGQVFSVDKVKIYKSHRFWTDKPETIKQILSDLETQNKGFSGLTNAQKQTVAAAIFATALSYKKKDLARTSIDTLLGEYEEFYGNRFYSGKYAANYIDGFYEAENQLDKSVKRIPLKTKEPAQDIIAKMEAALKAYLDVSADANASDLLENAKQVIAKCLAENGINHSQDKAAKILLPLLRRSYHHDGGNSDSLYSKYIQKEAELETIRSNRIVADRMGVISSKWYDTESLLLALKSYGIALPAGDEGIFRIGQGVGLLIGSAVAPDADLKAYNSASLKAREQIAEGEVVCLPIGSGTHWTGFIAKRNPNDPSVIEVIYYDSLSKAKSPVDKAELARFFGCNEDKIKVGLSGGHDLKEVKHCGCLLVEAARRFKKEWPTVEDGKEVDSKNLNIELTEIDKNQLAADQMQHVIEHNLLDHHTKKRGRSRRSSMGNDHNTQGGTEPVDSKKKRPPFTTESIEDLEVAWQAISYALEGMMGTKDIFVGFEEVYGEALKEHFTIEKGPNTGKIDTRKLAEAQKQLKKIFQENRSALLTMLSSQDPQTRTKAKSELAIKILQSDRSPAEKEMARLALNMMESIAEQAFVLNYKMLKERLKQQQDMVDELREKLGGNPIAKQMFEEIDSARTTFLGKRKELLDDLRTLRDDARKARRDLKDLEAKIREAQGTDKGIRDGFREEKDALEKRAEELTAKKRKLIDEKWRLNKNLWFSTTVTTLGFSGAIAIGLAIAVAAGMSGGAVFAAVACGLIAGAIAHWYTRYHSQKRQWEDVEREDASIARKQTELTEDEVDLSRREMEWKSRETEEKFAKNEYQIAQERFNDEFSEKKLKPEELRLKNALAELEEQSGFTASGQVRKGGALDNKQKEAKRLEKDHKLEEGDIAKALQRSDKDAKALDKALHEFARGLDPKQLEKAGGLPKVRASKKGSPDLH